MALVPPREPGDPLRPRDEARILELTEEGWTQERIAAEIGCHQSTVSRTLAEYDDSRPLARKHLEANALALARRFVEESRPAEILKMMGKLDVVRDDDYGHGEMQVAVVIGLEAGYRPTFSHRQTPDPQTDPQGDG